MLCPEKIEALLTLGRVKRSIQNLLLLLDALEEEECYVNAYWVLALIIEVDPEKGRDYFSDFYKRNFSLFNPQSVAR